MSAIVEVGRNSLAFVKFTAFIKFRIENCWWIAQCMQCGLLRGSFVPPAEVRQWRHLTRQRVRLIDQRTGVINRIHSLLEQGNIKLLNVASNIMDVSGRAMIKAMSQGESDPAKLAALSQGRLKADFEQLLEALDGQLDEKGALVAQASAGTGEDVGGRGRDL
jgi:hypothetical protein